MKTVFCDTLKNGQLSISIKIYASKSLDLIEYIYLYTKWKDFYLKIFSELSSYLQLVAYIRFKKCSILQFALTPARGVVSGPLWNPLYFFLFLRPEF